MTTLYSYGWLISKDKGRLAKAESYIACCMLSSVGSVLLRLGAWSYLPDFATRNLLSLCYRIISSRGGAPPQPGTQRWQTHYRVAYSLSVLAFLAYNLFEAARSTPPNLFQLLGVSPDADDVTLRSSYRAFAKRYHPDRAGSASEPIFMAVRGAYEALKDPMKRFAYERFGPDALSWRNCSVPMDYLRQGIMQSSGFYIFSGGILAIMSIVMKPSPVAFWRYMLLLSLFACELCLTAGPRSFGLLGTLFPARVAFQHVLLLHQLFVFLSVALSRVVPVLFPEKPTIRPEEPRTYEPWIQRLDTLGKLVDAEALRLLHLELHAMSSSSARDSPNPVDVTFDSVPPCNPPPEVLDTLTREMEDVLVEQFIRAEPPLRALWDVAVRKERERASEEVKPVLDSDDDGVPIMNGSSCSKHPSRLPSPSPSLSPEIQVAELPARANDERKLERVQDEDCETPTGSLPYLHPSPAQTFSMTDGSRLRTSSSRSFIRIVERQHSVSPD